MYRLFQFIFKYRTFFTLLVVQFVCLFIIVRKNEYHSTVYYGTVNSAVAKLVSTSNTVWDFIYLKEVNDDLAEENARLKKELSRLRLSIFDVNKSESKDGELLNKFDFLKAEVIDNTVSLTRNYFTIDKGSADGLKVDMGIVNSNGLTGKIKSVSKHFAVAASLLHLDVRTSVVIERNNAFGTLQWDGKDLLSANLEYVPRHINLKKGDTVVTSGYNAIYPKGVMVGTIREFQVMDESAFYSIKVDLAVDFTKLSHVYIIMNTLESEIDSIENKIILE